MVATLRVTGRLYAPWVPLAGGGVVRAFDEHLAPAARAAGWRREPGARSVGALVGASSEWDEDKVVGWV